MNSLTTLFQINGKPMPAPDRDVELSFQDVDASDAGRDEAGFMHRSVVRRKIGVWGFHYSHLTQQEYAYLCSLLPQGGSFRFTCPGMDGSGSRTVTAYLSNFGILWHSAKTNTYRNLKFNIIEC